MKRWNRHENLHTLGEEQVFSSEEIELLTQRINEELEYASFDILRTGEKSPGTASMMLPGGSKEEEIFIFGLQPIHGFYTFKSSF